MNSDIEGKTVDVLSQMVNTFGKSKEAFSRRSVSKVLEGIDFCSNDFLSLARSKELFDRSVDLIRSKDLTTLNGATGSRLISGNNELILQLEDQLAQFYNVEKGLVFSSGFSTNFGLFQALLDASSTVIYDELVHASIREGIRSGKATAFSFRHNDLHHLEERLKLAKGTTYIVVEALYSMDGDFAPLHTLSSLCDRYGAKLIVDEAHSNGIYGLEGRGLVNDLGLEEEVFARVITFGKTIGVAGGCVLGSQQLIDHLVNYSKSFIYSTGLPPFTVASTLVAYDLLPGLEKERNELRTLVSHFVNSSKNLSKKKKSASHIQTLLVPSNEKVLKIEAELQAEGFAVKAIRSPTVKKGEERIRICLHAHNTSEEIDRFISFAAKSIGC